MHGLNLAFLKDALWLCFGIGGRNFFWNDELIVGVALVCAIVGILVALKKWPAFFVIYLATSVMIVIFSGLEKLFIYPRFLSFFMPAFSVALLNLFDLPKIDQSAEKIKKIGTITNRISRLLICLVIFIILTGNLAFYYFNGKESFKESAQYLAQNYAPDKVICYGIICKELGYYYPKAMMEVDEKYNLTPELIKGKVIISRKVDWTQGNLAVARQYCSEEKVWASAGYKENILWLIKCP